MNEWISVEKRLPDEYIKPSGYGLCNVLVSTFNCGIPTVKLVIFFFFDGKFLKGMRDITKEVTAWMYLPEPFNRNKPKRED